MKNEYVNILLKLSRKAIKSGDIPVAAIIVKDDKIIAKAYNKKHDLKLPYYHAEMIAIKKACKKLNTWRLENCKLYVTLEPCPMCYYAIVEARISEVCYMSSSNYYDSINNKLSKINKVKCENFEYSSLLRNFFKKIRDKI